MEISTVRISGSLVVRASGDLRIWGHEAENDHLLNLLRAESDLPKQVILNLSQLTRVDSMGIGSLVRVVIECAKRDVGLKVVMPSGVAGEAIRCVRIFEAYPEFADEAAAI